MSVSVDGHLIESIPFGQAVEDLAALAAANMPSYAVTLNAQLLQIAYENTEFNTACEGASARYADGMPVLWAAKASGQRIIERITGADLEPALCARMQELGGQVLFIGGRPDVNEAAVLNRSKQFPGVQFKGFSPHYNYESDADESGRVLDLINSCATQPGPFAVMLCTGSPKSELFAAAHFSSIRRGVILCAGAAIDFAAGAKKRAGAAAQNSGLEWLVRLRQEPVRLGPRYAKNAGYLLGLLSRSYASRFRRDGMSIPDIPSQPVKTSEETV